MNPDASSKSYTGVDDSTERPLPYVPPKVESIRLTDDAAESMT